MKPELLSLLSFTVGIAAYSISQLQQHGKLRWMDKGFGFWGAQSWYRKYKRRRTGMDPYDFYPAPSNWYYKLIGSKYKERWFTSTWLTVNLTDGYHACQSIMFVMFSIGISLLSEINFFIIWCSLLVVNFVTYRVLQR